MGLKLARLWQPRTLLFWQMVVFNVLSSLGAWAMRDLPLNTAGMLLVGTAALLNCGFGMLATWRLLKGPDQPAGTSSASTVSRSE